jgi:cob(I)alamin adenosyltransferase
VRHNQTRTMTKIYTKTGDLGDTGLFDGTRVSKADPRVDAYGEIDELNAWLGMVRANGREQAGAGGIDTQIVDCLERLQRDLFAVGATLADPRHKIAKRVAKALITDADVARLEQWIDAFEKELTPLTRFILAGGSKAGATLHVARTVCRRAERRMVSLGDGEVDPVVLIFVNRLSDLLFVMARLVNARAGIPETEW